MARLPDDEIQRRYELALQQVQIDDDEAERRWPNCTPDERDLKKRQATIAAAKHATIVDDETGVRMLGGKQPRKNKADVMAAVTDLANGERQKEIVDALFAPLDRKEPAAVRGKGAERIVRLTLEQAELERRDREELRQLGKEELLDRLVKGILSSGMTGDLLKGLNAGAAVKVSQNGTPYDAETTASEAA